MWESNCEDGEDATSEMPTVQPPPPLPQATENIRNQENITKNNHNSKEVASTIHSLARRPKSLYSGADYHVYSVPKLYNSQRSCVETPSASSNKSPTRPNFAIGETDLVKGAVDSNSAQSVNVLPSNVPTTHYRLSRTRSNSIYKPASVHYYPLNRHGRYNYNQTGGNYHDRNLSGRYTWKPVRIMNTVSWMSIEDKPHASSVNSLSHAS